MRICLYYLGTRGKESVTGRIYDVEQVFIAINVVRNRYLRRQFTNGVNWRHNPRKKLIIPTNPKKDLVKIDFFKVTSGISNLYRQAFREHKVDAKRQRLTYTQKNYRAATRS